MLRIEVIGAYAYDNYIHGATPNTSFNVGVLICNKQNLEPKYFLLRQLKKVISTLLLLFA